MHTPAPPLFTLLTPQQLVELDAAMMRGIVRAQRAYGRPAVQPAFVISDGTGLIADLVAVRQEVAEIAYPRV